MSSVTFINHKQFAPGGTIYIAVMCRDDDGVPQPALVPTPACVVYNLVSGKWWNNTALEWGDLPVDNEMVELDAANLPGVYALTFDHEAMDPAMNERDYIFKVTSSAVGSPQDTIVISTRHTLETLKVLDGAVADPVETLAGLWRLLKIVFSHNSKLDDVQKREIFYREDGETSAMEFGLYDADGIPSTREPFERRRVV